jgi:regulatory protein RepA
MMDKQNLLKILNYIDPAMLNYQEWVNIGMALKEEGFTCSEWDNWSRKDSERYHSGEPFKKWDSFAGNPNGVTGGTIIQYAKDQGWSPTKDSYELDWDSVIGSKDEKDEMVIIDRNWVEGQEVTEPDKDKWNPVNDLIKYLETLFEASEYVGYVCDSWLDEDGRHKPKKGCCDRQAGQLIQELRKCKNDIGSILGDYNQEAGAWIRFNPLDGKTNEKGAVTNANVTDYRYALVESDHIDLEKQNAIIREMELPVACLVHSGKKSIHAIVKINADTYDEYRKRVDYLYDVCAKNGLKVDTQNRNPSRLSRMPGVMRNGQKQFLIDTNIGKPSWNEWKEWIEAINDDLPEPESMASVWDNLPDLSPPLIDGLLRQGHKMLLAGPSKAGKSYALIELCCAVAEGKNWFNWPCTQGKIMYVNLELDRASCLHRFKDVYQALGWEPKNVSNIDIWNLRGKSVPMDKLAPKLIRRAQKKNYIAVIIDPIYKVITGDENSADQMAHFCNQFDKVCTELGCAVIYCHHHSKGGQGGKKSMDRASGSGVFARDPDALLDLIELDLSEALIKQEENKAVCKVCESWLKKYSTLTDVTQDDLCSESAMMEHCKRLLQPALFVSMMSDINQARKAVQSRTAWRIEGTLREFPKFSPVNLWFDYPVHNVDTVGSLKDAETEGERPPWQRAISKRKPKEVKAKSRKESTETAFEACSIDGEVTIESMAEYMGVSEKTVRSRIKEHGKFEIDLSAVRRKKT